MSSRIESRTPARGVYPEGVGRPDSGRAFRAATIPWARLVSLHGKTSVRPALTLRGVVRSM